MWGKKSSVPKHVLIQNIDRIGRSTYANWKSQRESFARNVSRDRATTLEELNEAQLEFIFSMIE